MELTRQLLVVAKQVADLTGTYADIACGYVHVGANHLVKLAHEGLTELHHLIVALATD